MMEFINWNGFTLGIVVFRSLLLGWLNSPEKSLLVPCPEGINLVASSLGDTWRKWADKYHSSLSPLALMPWFSVESLPQQRQVSSILTNICLLYFLRNQRNKFSSPHSL